jgi:hypothetical protein
MENGRGRRQKENGEKRHRYGGLRCREHGLTPFLKEYGNPSESDFYSLSLTCHGTLIHSGFLFIREHVSGDL